MISVSIELGISELTRKEMTSRIKHVGATHQSLLAKAWASVASATPCISFDVAELLLKEIYEQHIANPIAVESILGEHCEWFLNKANFYAELIAAEKNVHEIAARYMATKKPEVHVKLNKAKDFADAFAMMLNTLNEIQKVRQVDEELSKNKGKAKEPIKEGAEEFVLGKHSGTYYRLIGESSKMDNPVDYLKIQINKLIDLTNNKLSKVLPGLIESLQKDIADLEAYVKELQQKDTYKELSKNKEKAGEAVKKKEDEEQQNKQSHDCSDYCKFMIEGSKASIDPVQFIKQFKSNLEDTRKNWKPFSPTFNLIVKDIQYLTNYLLALQDEFPKQYKPETEVI